MGRRRRRKQVNLIDKEPDTRESSAWTVGGRPRREDPCILRKERIRHLRNFRCKNRKINPSTSVQKSVQLANWGACNSSTSPFTEPGNLSLSKSTCPRPHRNQGTRPCPHYRALDGDRELVHVPEAIAIGHYILIRRTQNA
jgi:hypothetical protein